MAEDKKICAGCHEEIDITSIDCDMYHQYWCIDCGGVGQCGECGHMIACCEMNFDDDSGEGICEDCLENNDSDE